STWAEPPLAFAKLIVSCDPVSVAQNTLPPAIAIPVAPPLPTLVILCAVPPLTEALMMFTPRTKYRLPPPADGAALAAPAPAPARMAALAATAAIPPTIARVRLIGELLPAPRFRHLWSHDQALVFSPGLFE